MKVFELAKELGLTSPTILETIKILGFESPKNHFSVISPEIVDNVRRYLLRQALNEPIASSTTSAVAKTPETSDEKKIVVRRKREELKERKDRRLFSFEERHTSNTTKPTRGTRRRPS